MDPTTRWPRLARLTLAVGVAGWIAACTTPQSEPAVKAQPAAAPDRAPAAEPPKAPEPTAATAPEPAAPTGPAAVQQAQRLANTAVEMLELGKEEEALAEIQRSLQLDPANRLSQSLLKQIQTDPHTLLGRESFSYRVEPGESLSRIAGRFLKDIHLFYALARYNDIKVPRQVQGGQLIKVPGKQPAAAAAAPVPVPAPTPVAVNPRPAAPEPSTQALIAQDYRRGLSLMAQQKPAEAIEAFDKVLDREPSHANARLKRAQAMTQIGGLIRLYENTIRQADAELAKNPGNAAAKARRDKAAAERERLAAIK